jgi:hypothetical protein
VGPKARWSRYHLLLVAGEQAAPAGDGDRLGASVGPQLGHEVGHVDADGLGTYVQLLADIAVATAESNEGEDLLLPAGQGLIPPGRLGPR